MVTGIIRKWFAQRRPRGAAVPFESPALRMARVCDDERDGLIAVLRDFANNGTVYIVPWTSLPLIATMTDHDKAVHAAVGETRACYTGAGSRRRQQAGAVRRARPGGQGARRRTQPRRQAQARRRRAGADLAPAG